MVIERKQKKNHVTIYSYKIIVQLSMIREKLFIIYRGRQLLKVLLYLYKLYCHNNHLYLCPEYLLNPPNDARLSEFLSLIPSSYIYSSICIH
jgi:hypothetical protein